MLPICLVSAVSKFVYNILLKLGFNLVRPPLLSTHFFSISLKLSLVSMVGIPEQCLSQHQLVFGFGFQVRLGDRIAIAVHAHSAGTRIESLLDFGVVSELLQERISEFLIPTVSLLVSDISTS